MSTVQSTTAVAAAHDQPQPSTPASPTVPSGWIRDRWSDLALFIATPLLIVPVVGLARTRLSVEQVALYVTSFGAMGHHLPGMLRAYGDRDLFLRFRTRFLLAPVLLLAVALLFAAHDLRGLILVAVLWATWHAWMQVYGFLRIYDAKAGSVAGRTARLDMLMCSAWFVAGVLFSPSRLGQLLKDFYRCGGMPLSPGLVQGAQWTWAMFTAGVTVAFVRHAVAQWRAGRPPSRLKLLLLVTSVGFWWYAMIGVNNAILGVAMFEVFHDVQYLSIVWLFNRRRAVVAGAGRFTRFVFQGGGVMLGLYLGLVFAYGALGLLPEVIETDVVNRVLAAVFVTSGLLHFYYDGFIWKVRERSTREGLGLASGSAAEERTLPRGLLHAAKWAPFAAAVGWLGWAQAHSTNTPEQQLQQVVAAVPDAWQVQLELGVEWLRLGDLDQALGPLEAAASRAPEHADAHYRLGHVLARLKRTTEAMHHLARATELDPHLVDAHVDLGVLLAERNLRRSAEDHYRQALRDDPQHVQALNNLGALLSARGALDEARDCFTRALALEADNAQIHMNLGIVEMRRGRLDAATDCLERAVALNPDSAEARVNLGAAYAQQGRLDHANEEYRAVLALEPHSIAALNSLAWNLVTSPAATADDAAHAVLYAERAAELTSRRDLQVLQTLAAAYAGADRFDDAATTAEYALAEARTLKVPLAVELEAQLARYRAKQAWVIPAR